MQPRPIPCSGRLPRRALFKPPTLCLLAVLVLANFSFASPSSAKERHLKKFFSEIVVMPDGSVDVTENITVQFVGGPWHGISREIPIEYSGPHGSNYTLFLDVKGVTGDTGAKLRYETSRERHYLNLKIYIPDADNSTRTISIDYTVSDAIKFFADYDEFFWNVTGDEWSIPIESAGAHIVLPEGAANLRAKAFTGAFRSTGRDADLQISGTAVDVQTRDPLPMHEGLTISVAFDKGAIREPSALSRVSRFLLSNWPLFIPIAAFFAMFWWWWTHGRDPRLRPIAAQYQPPDNLSPGEVGTLIDNSVDMRDITASIVDLAVRGYLTIEEKQQDHLLGLTHSKSYVFHLKKARAEWNSLKPHEQELLDGIFSGGNAGDAVPLDALHNTFYANIPGIRNQIFASLVGDGYYAQRPDSVRSGYILFGVVIGFILVAGGIWVSNHSGMQPLPFVVAGLLTGAIICGFGWFMSARTQAGARALEGVLGFEDFLAHVESDRFNRTIKTPEMFEKFLPFAMALGVEKNWSKAFQGIYTQPPQWYQGSYGPGFYPYMFANDLGSMSSMASDVMTSAPRSAEGSAFSSDSGGGGGGFEGGGFGGGGGDAF